MKQKSFDKFLFIGVLLTIVFGIIMIYSASYIWADYKFADPFKFVKAQGLFFIVGIFLMLFISKIDYHLYQKKANLILFICLALLILVLIPGVGKIRNGSRSWFGIGSLGIQPSEFAKIGLIICSYYVRTRFWYRYGYCFNFSLHHFCFWSEYFFFC